MTGSTITTRSEPASAPVGAGGLDEDADQPQKANVAVLALLTVAHTVVDAYATTVPALLPFWQQRFDLTYGLAGLITAMSNVTSSVAQPIVGMITDRGRDPRWIALACLVAALGVSATGLAHQYGLFLVLVVVGGLGVSAFHPQGYKLTGLYAGRSQGTATSWFLVGGNVGVALGPPIGAAVVLRLGLEGTVWLAIPGVAFATLIWWLLPRWAQRRTRVARATALPAQGGAPAPDQRQDRELAAAAAVRRLSLHRRTVAIGVLIALVAVRATVSSSLISFVPLYLVRVAGAGEERASQVLAGMLLVGAVATLGGGYVADRWGRTRTLAASLVVVPPLLLAFLALPATSLPAIAALIAAGAMITATFSITVVLAQELWYERRALASGVIVGLAFGLGGLLVPAVGKIADVWDLATALKVVAALPLVAIALVFALGLILNQRHVPLQATT